jgi:hypothetical protein
MTRNPESVPHSFADGVPGGNGIFLGVPQAAHSSTNSNEVASIPDAWLAHEQRTSSAQRVYSGANRWLGALIGYVTLPEDDAPADLLGKLVTSTPPWLISLIVHFSFMIFLGLLVIGAQTITKHDDSIEVDLSRNRDNERWAEKLGEQLDDPSAILSHDGIEKLEKSAAAIATSELPEVDDPLVGPPVLSVSPEGNFPSGTINTPAIALELSGRQQGVRDAMVKSYGGTKLTEDAVKEGLRWLMRQQQSRGHWSLKGPYKGGANSDNDEVATAMALLAFQGAGYTPDGNKSDPFTKVVAKGWHALLRSQQKDGHFFGNLAGESHQLYTQAICTIALCELYGMTHDEKYLEPAQRAVDYCVKIQAPEGGWRYQPGVDSDMSVTGWFAMAMQSARMAGIEVPSPVFEKIGKFLDSVARDEGVRYAYLPNAGATLTLTAEGLLSRQYLGWQHDDQRLKNGVDLLLANLPEWDKRNVYYWYYATQVCHHMEGEQWQKWNKVMRQLLPENQEKRGTERGSWSPDGDRWGGAGGRLYVTCLSIYTLEVYYRHLPIYQRNASHQ